MTGLLDPWADAQAIAQRLAEPGARLVVLLGAEAWCEKCRVMRPLFESRASSTAPNEIWVWLDLEDHAEFIGDFLTDDLPWLIVHRGSALVFNGIIEATISSLEIGLTEPSAQRTDAPVPDVRARLLQTNWAS